MEQLVRKAVRGLAPYQAPYIEEGIKLDANENIYPMPECVKTHMTEWIKKVPVNYYPDTTQAKLREVIAKCYNVEPAQVSVGVGSDQLIDCILRVFVERDDYVVVPTPSFSMYDLGVRLAEGQLIKVPFNEDFSYNVVALEEAVYTYNPKVTFICHPNNPTGTPMSLEELERIVVASKGIVVIDEAYGEFCDISGIALLDRYENVVVLRTFSKAYGLAGARVGYAIGSLACIRWIDTIKPPYALSAFSEEIAYYVMSNRDIYIQITKSIKETREWVKGQLIQLDIEVWPSETNFLWMKPSMPLRDMLQDYGIYIRQWSAAYQDFYRMSIGTKEQMEKVIEKLKEVKEGKDENGTDYKKDE